MTYKLRSKEFYGSILLLGFLVLSFILMTDFGLFISNMLILVPLSIIAAYFLLRSLSSDISIDIGIVFYSLCIVSLCMINILFRSGFNLLLFMPVISYLFFKFIQDPNKSKIKKEFDYFAKFLVVIFFLIAIFELSVKILGFDFLGYKSFLLEHGDRRIDVLRVRTLFGSPLSTTALCIFFFAYFSFFRKSYLFLFLSAILAFLSGSRTAIVILILMISFSVFESIYNNRVKLKALYYSLLGVAVLVAVITYTPVGAIIIRSLTLQADASFVSRSNTTVQTFQDLLSELPGSLFVGLKGEWISDSAITSIMAGSGVVAFFVFAFLFLLLLTRTQIPVFYKIAIVLTSSLGAMMIGDFFVPAVSFLYFMTFLIYSRESLLREAPSGRGRPASLVTAPET